MFPSLVYFLRTSGFAKCFSYSGLGSKLTCLVGVRFGEEDDICGAGLWGDAWSLGDVRDVCLERKPFNL